MTNRRVVFAVSAAAAAVLAVTAVVFALVGGRPTDRVSFRPAAALPAAPSPSSPASPSAGPSSAGPSAGPSSAPPPATAAGCGPWGCERWQAFQAAAALAKTKPGYLGMVVRDRQTGAIWRTGTSDHVMWTSSTIKLAMATSILERARTGEVTVDAAARSQIAAMFSVSDNDAADALWKRYGQDRMVPRFRDVYGMTGLTFVPGSPRYWGFMKSSAEDLQRLMSYVLDRLDPADRAYVVDAMRHVGQIQQWGVWAAGAQQRPGTKDGWSIESDPGGKHWCTSTVGFVGPGERYVVAVMYHLPPGTGTIGAGVHAVSDLVATAFGVPTPAKVTVPDPSTGL
jgi:hypothetical protein